MHAHEQTILNTIINREHIALNKGKVMKTVINLSTDHEWHYMDNVSDLFAVCSTYCLNNNLQSWFISLVSNKMDYTETLPITNGKQTLACGDYCIVKSDKPELKLY